MVFCRHKKLIFPAALADREKFPLFYRGDPQRGAKARNHRGTLESLVTQQPTTEQPGGCLMKKNTQHSVVLLVFSKEPFAFQGIPMNREYLQNSHVCKSWATHTQFYVSQGKNQHLFSIIVRPQCHGNPLCGLPWDLRKQGCANIPFLFSCSAGEGYDRNER